MSAPLTLVAIALLAVGCGRGPASEQAATTPAPPLPTQTGPVLAAPAGVNDCQPCRIELSAAAGIYAFRFATSQDGAGRVVRSIDVFPPQAATSSQTLAVSDMMPVLAGGQFFFGGIDLDMDGQKDLMLATSRGAANSFATYWLFNVAAHRFDVLGDFPVFTSDPSSGRLKTYENNGSGGMAFEAKEYAFVEGKLLVMRAERQEPIDGSDSRFRHVIEERRGSSLVVVKQETVKGKQ